MAATHVDHQQNKQAVIPSVPLLDPSDYRPEYKQRSEFRNYTNKDITNRVYQTYKKMHTFQTVGYVRQSLARWTRFNRTEMTIMEAIEKLDHLVDESDPDLDCPNSFHAFQTAEGIRQQYPDEKWFQITGLIHDLGKVLAVWNEPQWAVVGDTFPVGCRPADSVVFGLKSFENNPDLKDPVMTTKLGIYSQNCGLENVLMSWGHDEYLYQVLRNHNECHLPEEALYVIRYHSFYPWHTGGDYYYLCNNKDLEMLKWVQRFSKFDLYTKSPNVPDVEELRPYYKKLIDEYLPGNLKW